MTVDNSPIRFDQFMADALYGPRGYYTSPRPILGHRGDFTTTPKLDQSLATAIAGWITLQWKAFGKTLPVIECGPGDGTLARDIRAALPFLKRRKLDYHLVEISPHLRQRQKKTLSQKGTWHSTLIAALETTGHQALIISNEFFDAFPVRIFRKADPGFEELSLQGTAEIWQTPTALPSSTLFNQDWPLGQRLEVAESIREFFHEELSFLETGAILTIDYGGTPEENYHRRPLGTLRAYFHHQLLAPPQAYQNPGHQDLTFDVNFNDLIHWGNEIGLNKTSLHTQADFLSQPNNLPLQAFKVLEQTTT
ncbi:MAG: SAM-dependent methyltransferase [Verrucomicrobiaceae bacterium]